MQLFTEEATTSFAYRAQLEDGQPISGTIDATDPEDARHKLRALRLQIIDLSPAGPPARGRPLSSEDFIAFNQQLGHLTAAGLPMEHGLRLVAQDMRRGRLASTIRTIADELEAGKSLAEVFDQHSGRFPSMYGRLLEAGVRSNNLSGMLFGLAQHLELVRRLRATLWRTLSYPLMVLVALGLVMIFLSGWVLPEFEKVFGEFMVSLPWLTEWMLAIAPWVPAVGAVMVGALVVAPIVWRIAQCFGQEGRLSDCLVLPLPLVGSVVRRGLIAGWCDALRMGVEAGLDLPAAIGLAGDASASPRLRKEGQALIERLESGQSLEGAAAGRVLPATVVTGIALGMRSNDLPGTLRSLSEMYRQQAEMRLQALPVILTPLLLGVMAAGIGTVILAMLLPVARLMSALTGGKF